MREMADISLMVIGPGNMAILIVGLAAKAKKKGVAVARPALHLLVVPLLRTVLRAWQCPALRLGPSRAPTCDRHNH